MSKEKQEPLETLRWNIEYLEGRFFKDDGSAADDELRMSLDAMKNALTLLKQPKCTTCGDSKRVPSEYGLNQCSSLPIKDTKPCPDCQQPAAVEHPTIENTEVCPCGNLFVDADDYDTLGSESGVCCPDCGNEKFQTVKDRLDSAESINKDLVEACVKAKSIIQFRRFVMKRCPNPELVDEIIFGLEAAISKANQ